MTFTPPILAFTLLRIAVGLNILLHGLMRVGENYPKFVQWTQGLFAEAPLPSFAVDIMAYSIPPLEIVIGISVLFGVLTLPSLVLGTLLMIGLMAGMCILQKWDIVGLQMLYILLYVILIYQVHLNALSLDGMRLRKR